MKKCMSRIPVFLFSIFAIGCISREDEYFPEFTVQAPVIVSINNQPVLVDGVYRSPEICRVHSVDVANQIYEYLRDNYNGEWETVNFTNYAPSYHIKFGDIRIAILDGGMTMRLPRSNYFLAYKEKMTFVKFVPQSETFKLIRRICPDADLAGMHESPPVVQIAVRNMSGQAISDVTIAGGGQTRSIASIEPLQTAAVSLIPEADSELELSFPGTAADRVDCHIRTFLTPSMNGKVEIDITDDMECKTRRDSTSLF